MKAKIIKIKEQLLIVSDEEIKEGDWFYSYYSLSINKRDKDKTMLESWEYNKHHINKKIIASFPAIDTLPQINPKDLSYLVERLNEGKDDVELEMEQYTQNYHKDIWYNKPKLTDGFITIKREEKKELTCSTCGNLKQYMECNKTRLTVRTYPVVPHWCPLKQSSSLNNIISAMKEYASQSKSVPSDEEIEKEAKSRDEGYNHHYGFIQGAKWMRLQLPNERFTMPKSEDLIKTAIIFNEGVIDEHKLSDMVGMCQFVLDRLYANNDILKQTQKEKGHK